MLTQPSQREMVSWAARVVVGVDRADQDKVVFGSGLSGHVNRLDKRRETY